MSFNDLERGVGSSPSGGRNRSYYGTSMTGSGGKNIWYICYCYSLNSRL